jgi:acyl-CoA synthetase (AMP-forming)/AMP-acid ligase II/thioesterase domain-containing protein
MSMSFAPDFCALSDSEETAAAPVSIAELLLRVARHPGDYPRRSGGLRFIMGECEEDTLLDYPGLLREAQHILGGLQQLGRPPGTKVVLLLERAADFVPAFWGCVLGGYVPCPLSPIRHDPGRWAGHLAQIRQLLDEPLFITRKSWLPDLPPACAAELSRLRASPPQEQWLTGPSQAPALLVLTSGSTGNAKAVVLTHANLLASMAAKQECQRLTSADVTLNWIAFDHVAALLEAHLLPLYTGAAQVHVDPAAISADPLLFLRLLARHRITMSFAPNFLFGQINAALDSWCASGPGSPALALDLSCVRHIISGGEPIVVDTARRFLERLAPYGLSREALWPAFGMTETCAGSVYSREFHRDPSPDFAALGAPVSGLSLRIVDECDQPLPDGQTGELQLRGPMICAGYHNNTAATCAAFTADGWFRSGDLGRLEQGRLRLVGRSKDSIIINGVNYYSHELETVLQRLTGIEPGFVAAFPTRPAGADTEQLVVVFTPAFPFEDDARLHQLMVAIRNTTVLLWGFRPALVMPLPRESFFKTSLGKTPRARLRQRLESGELATHQAYLATLTTRQLGEYVPPQGPVEHAIAALFVEFFGVEKVSAGANFFDLGGTSLEIVRLTQRLTERCGGPALPLATILQNPTVQALAKQTAARRGDVDYDPVVPLQRLGTRTPLFCVHAASGEVLIFLALAQYFANERPVFGLRARGFNPGERPFASFDELVGAYVEALRHHQPRGPYALLGYSYGAAVAFEMAQRLESQGEEVAFLGSLDGTVYIGDPRGRFDKVQSAVNLAFFLSLLSHEQLLELPTQLRATPNLDPSAAILGQASSERLAQLDLDLPKFKNWVALSHALVQAGEAYVPAGKVESVTVFHADPLDGGQDEWLQKRLRQWDEFTRSPNRYLKVPGEHHTLLSPKHVTSLQAMLRSELDRALEGG